MKVLKSLPLETFLDNVEVNVIAFVATCFILYSFGLMAYRLFFSPLAGFPGSRIAAATHFYEFYYDWWCQGKHIYQIEKMHQKYGVEP